MRIVTRRVAGVFTSIALAAGLSLAFTPTAGASGLIGDNLSWDAYDPVAKERDRLAYPGQFIDFTGDLTREDGTRYLSSYCTLGAVGTDSAGRKIGVTAGHCAIPRRYKAGDLFPLNDDTSRLVKYDAPARGVPLSANTYPVFDRNAAKWAQEQADKGNPEPEVSPIGWVRWVDADVCDDNEAISRDEDGTIQYCPADDDLRPTDIDSLTDYMVIEFAPDVQMTSQVYDQSGDPVTSTAGNGPFKVNSTYTRNGSVALPRVFPYNDTVETYGAVSAREPLPATTLTYGMTAPSSGITIAAANGLFRPAVGSQSGDSGGPVVMRGTGQWVGIITGELPRWNLFGAGIDPYPFVVTSAKNILDDLNLKNRPFGKGFTPINN
ncbi:hypothetical protein [Rhodococcus triatomae]